MGRPTENRRTIRRTLVLRAFLDIRMYAVPNSGWWYDAGFLLGIAVSLPLGWIAALIAVVQHVL